jgi:hypothetical protein
MSTLQQLVDANIELIEEVRHLYLDSVAFFIVALCKDEKRCEEVNHLVDLGPSTSRLKFHQYSMKRKISFGTHSFPFPRNVSSHVFRGRVGSLVLAEGEIYDEVMKIVNKPSFDLDHDAPNVQHIVNLQRTLLTMAYNKKVPINSLIVKF